MSPSYFEEPEEQPQSYSHFIQRVANLNNYNSHRPCCLPSACWELSSPFLARAYTFTNHTPPKKKKKKKKSPESPGTQESIQSAPAAAAPRNATSQRPSSLHRSAPAPAASSRPWPCNRPRRPQQPRRGGTFTGNRTLRPASRPSTDSRHPQFCTKICEPVLRLISLKPDTASNLSGASISRLSAEYVNNNPSSGLCVTKNSGRPHFLLPQSSFTNPTTAFLITDQSSLSL